MKKYLIFIPFFIFAGLFYYISVLNFNKDNETSLRGEYIANIDDRLELSSAQSTLKNIKDEKARELEQVKVDELKASLMAPAKELDRKQWYKNYVVSGLGMLSIMSLFTTLLVSFLVFLRLLEKELRAKDLNY